MADHRLFAATYDHMLALSEARGLAGRRRDLLAGARGRVLEVGAGTGLNLAHYPPGAVTSLVALEPDGAMRRRLEARVGAGTCPVPCRVEAADVACASFPAGSFDTVVCALVLCSVADPATAVTTIAGWLAPGGQLLFLEHVHAVGLTGRVQSVVAPFWQRAAAGCRLDRDTLALLRAGGLVVTDCDRFALPAGGPLLSACVQGVARPRPIGLEGAA